jgi:putative ABC transport system permease protein
MKALDRKLLRDIGRMWAQALAIALVMASGVATLILAVGAQHSLVETREAYYERYRFADVFAHVTRAPRLLESQMLQISGVAAVELRIAKYALLDIEGFVQPASGLVLSLPDHRESRLNRLYLRAGRLPEPGRADEVVVNEAFAKAHAFSVGATFKAILNGRKRILTIVGIALSPEFIYAVGPGDFVPDDKRFADMWMSEKALAALFDLTGAFNNVSVKLLKGASERGVIGKLDTLLDRYGGTGAYGRKDQFSHAFLDSELEQLGVMARIIPPVFLAVAAFLINMTLSRLIALEREQIGLLKALGYARIAVAVHYLKLMLVISAVGIAIGFVFGTWFGRLITGLYADFFHFPFLIFRREPEIYAIAAGVTALAAIAGGLRAVLKAAALPPAVAMAEPAPTRYRRLWLEAVGLARLVSQLTMMALRHLIRWPVRAGMTTLGIALSAALLIMALFSLDALEVMIDVTYFRTDRQDATINFSAERPMRVVQAVEHLPGIMRAEPFRAVSVRLKNGHLFRTLAVFGKPEKMELSRVLDHNFEPIVLPETGLVISERIADVLKLRRGDLAEIEILEGRRGTVRVPVTSIIKSYFGLIALMNIDALAVLLDEVPQASGVHIAYDRTQTDRLFTAVKDLPAVASIGLQKASLAKFRETIAKNVNVMISIYVALSMIIAFGVVYNSARIQLSERGRELASLRVLGFTRAEVSWVLLVELAIMVIIAQPLGWLLGYGLALVLNQGFNTDLYRLPFVIFTATYAKASLVVLGAAIISAFAVRRRIDRLDLIAVLKTRE